MVARLVFNPVVVVGDARLPKCATLVDPGRPPVEATDDDGTVRIIPRTYVHSSAISDGLPGQLNAACISLCAGVDMSNLDADSQIIKVFEDADPMLSGLKAWLNQTPQQMGYNNPKLNRLRNRMTAQGISSTGLTSANALWEWVNRACQAYSPGFDVRRAWTTAPGA
jgi:hypothetical protein